MFQILIVDDNPGDIALMRDLLSCLSGRHEVHFASDGIDALTFLHCRGPYVDATRPDLVLLDVQMPRMNGLELLARIKTDSELTVIPVIMLSTSMRPDDIRSAYRAHANCYVKRPTNLDDAEKLVRAIEAFWINVALLPKCQDQPESVRLPMSGATK